MYGGLHMLGTGPAEAAVKAAERRQLPVPQGVYDAAAMYKVLLVSGHEPHPDRPTPADIPATPEQLRQLIEKQAEAKRHADSIRDVASTFHDAVLSNYNQLVRDTAPGWIQSLQPEFNALVKALSQQARKLPSDLRVGMLDWNDPKVSAAWEKAESAAHQLDQLVRDRSDMAQAIGGDGVRDNALFAVVQFPTPTDELVLGHQLRDKYGPMMREWKDLAQQPVSRWLYLARQDDIKLVLATPTEVRDRSAAMQRWRDAISAMSTAGSRTQAEHAVHQALAA